MDKNGVRKVVIRAGEKWGALAVILFALSTGAAANLDPSFQGHINGTVIAIALQSDGRIVVGGSFTSVNGIARSYLARLHADGSLDSAFNPSTSTFQFVRQLVVRDGKIYAAAGDGLRRLDTSGNVEWHYPMSVLAFDVDSQQRVVFGGQFTRLENQFHRNLARLDAGGALDATFTTAIGCCAGESVNAVLAQGDALLVGGLFQSVNGEPAAHLARIQSDSSRDNSFRGLADAPVVALVPAGNGAFFHVSPQFFSRHLSDGSVDSGFAALSANSSDDRFTTAAVQPDGKALVGGSFTTSDGGSVKHVLRLNSNGSVDTSFSIEPNDTVQSIAVAADGTTLLGGAFTTVNGLAAAGLARITAEASNVPAPTALCITADANQRIVLSWNASSDVILESRSLNSAEWSAVQQPAVTFNGRAFVTNASAGAGQLFRLRAR